MLQTHYVLVGGSAGRVMMRRLNQMVPLGPTHAPDLAPEERGVVPGRSL
jgi:hypothetical protein